MKSGQSIAIVGIGGIFPGSPDLDTYWNTIKNGISVIKDVPEGRWLLSPDEAFSPSIGAPDKVCSIRGGFIEGFDAVTVAKNLGISPYFLEELDPMFGILLHAGHQAFTDAVTDSIDRSKVGVIIGNIVLPNEKTSALTREILGRTFEEKIIGPDASIPFKKNLPINRFAAGLPAGILAKALGLGGGTFTLDAACASSLYALKYAVDHLLSGRADAMLAGGLSRPDCLYTQMGFSQLRALSPTGTCSPFCVKGDGLVVGEGSGMFLLKRTEDAIQHGDHIYALIKGIGLSSDIGGSLLAPSSEGQLRAMRPAYDQAGWTPMDVDLIECHATGTPVGDGIEFKSLMTLWDNGTPADHKAVIGSVKSNIGHLLTAAGSAALMKVLLSLKHKTLAPTANFTNPHPDVNLEKGPFKILVKAEPWNKRNENTPRRAAISAFGFGGINAHVLIEEWEDTSSRETSQSMAHVEPVPIAVVGMDAHFGPWQGLEKFQERVLGKDDPVTPEPSRNWWGVTESEWYGKSDLCRIPFSGYFINGIEISLNKYRIPPKELEDMLPQQLLMLEVAAGAVKDAGLNTGNNLKTGLFVGIGLDFNTTNFQMRWWMPKKAREWADKKGLDLDKNEFDAWLQSLKDAFGPALSANRTMGALGGIVASRIAREFHVGGPSFTISSEETSGIHALETAVMALRNREIDNAIAGAVDIAGDVRAVIAGHEDRAFSVSGTSDPFCESTDGAIIGEGAAAVVLKRLDDAIHDNDRIYAVIRNIGNSSGGAVKDTVPDKNSCVRSFERVFDETGIHKNTISFIETHGSGHPDEDRMEASAMAEFYAEADSRPRILGSAKKQIGHSGAASGLASFVKACLCVYQEILPPLNISQKNVIPERLRLSSIKHPQYYMRNRAEGPRRAAVTCFSVDGNCTHVILEGYEKDTSRHMERIQPLGERNNGLFLVRAENIPDILKNLSDLKNHVKTTDSIEYAARQWWMKTRGNPDSSLCLAFVSRSRDDLLEQMDFARVSIERNPHRKISGNNGGASKLFGADRVFFSPEPFAEKGNIAFVFPGSGNHFAGMGRELSVQWPDVFRNQDKKNLYLHEQFLPDVFWNSESTEALNNPRATIFGQVALGTAVSDLTRSFNVCPSGAIGYSLGETTAFFSLGAWTDRDGMLARINGTDLFTRVLAGECDAARKTWNLDRDEKVDWILGVVNIPEKAIEAAIKNRTRVYLLIVNTPDECVIGGDRNAVKQFIKDMGCRFFPLFGVTTVHCEVVKQAEKAYRDLHLFNTVQPENIRFYSGFSGKSYVVNRESAADSITGNALHGLNYPNVIKQAYEDGMRIFLEMGPGSSCTRMINEILNSQPHIAMSVCPSGKDAVTPVLKVLAQLEAERIPGIDLSLLYRTDSFKTVTVESTRFIRLPAGGKPFRVPVPEIHKKPEIHENFETQKNRLNNNATPGSGKYSHAQEYTTAVSMEPVLRQMEATREAGILAHETYLRFSSNNLRNISDNIAFQLSLIELMESCQPDTEKVTSRQSFHKAKVTPVFDRNMCMEFATGSIAKVLGPEFLSIDDHPTRVRLPDEPLMLVDRILALEGEQRALKSGRVITEHDIHENAWYLDFGRIPTCIAVEAGQADLFLSGYLGIDFVTMGKAVYRLLDAVVTFHRELPGPGEVIHYDIKIDSFFKQGDTFLFRFNFEGTVNGEPLLTMKDGCAGFFTQKELDQGKGVVHTDLDRRRIPGKRPADWTEFVSMGIESYDCEQLEALRNGDLSACFGPLFEGLDIRNPVSIPGGRMHLVDRVLQLDPCGGRFGLGQIRAEADIHPDDWFLTCHFVDDRVMPGTLMYECCLHTLRIYLLRMGWVGEKDNVTFGPVPGVPGQLKCRGQVIESTKKVIYEISIKELGYMPEPYAVVDALIYADGKPIVEIIGMSARFQGMTKESVKAIWENRKEPKVLFDYERILAFAIGKPSEAFGEPYRIFDNDRVIARLPGPPYQFLDRIIKIRAEQWKMIAGGEIEAEYDVPPDEWYFNECGDADAREMPFAVLLEVALQPCGWLAGYIGSALTSETDLCFRNLGGSARFFRQVLPDAGTLATKVKITNVASTGGMIIQNFDMEVKNNTGTVYKGDTYFGFFSRQALANQVGIPGARPYQPGQDEISRGISFEYPGNIPFPKERLRMIDTIDLYVPDGGPEGLGFIRGIKKIDPGEWFFKAHFYQDPVCPGSLGLESFLQLLMVIAEERWGKGLDYHIRDIKTGRPGVKNFTMATGDTHTWLYRGQVLPTDHQVTCQASIKAIHENEKKIVAEGFLIVDGRIIYQMNDFVLKAVMV